MRPLRLWSLPTTGWLLYYGSTTKAVNITVESLNNNTGLEFPNMTDPNGPYGDSGLNVGNSCSQFGSHSHHSYNGKDWYIACSTNHNGDEGFIANLLYFEDCFAACTKSYRNTVAFVFAYPKCYCKKKISDNGFRTGGQAYAWLTSYRRPFRAECASRGDGQVVDYFQQWCGLGYGGDNCDGADGEGLRVASQAACQQLCKERGACKAYFIERRAEYNGDTRCFLYDYFPQSHTWDSRWDTGTLWTYTCATLGVDRKPSGNFFHECGVNHPGTPDQVVTLASYYERFATAKAKGKPAVVWRDQDRQCFIFNDASTSVQRVAGYSYALLDSISPPSSAICDDKGGTGATYQGFQLHCGMDQLATEIRTNEGKTFDECLALCRENDQCYGTVFIVKDNPLANRTGRCSEKGLSTVDLTRDSTCNFAKKIASAPSISSGKPATRSSTPTPAPPSPGESCDELIHQSPYKGFTLNCTTDSINTGMYLAHESHHSFRQCADLCANHPLCTNFLLDRSDQNTCALYDGIMTYLSYNPFIDRGYKTFQPPTPTPTPSAVTSLLSETSTESCSCWVTAWDTTTQSCECWVTALY